MVQLSILKIVGYGPWTLTLGSDREHELQMLQASLYVEVQRLFSEKGCLVFPNRADELFAVSNGLDLDGHIRIQETLASKFDVRLRILLGDGDTPGTAHRVATAAGAGSELCELNAEHRIFGPADLGSRTGRANILHMDVDGLSGMTLSSYDTSILMFGLYGRMSQFFYERDSLAFFMGGDNFMIAASEEAKADTREFIDEVEQKDGVALNCGIGSGETGREAAKLATMSLDEIRKMRDSKMQDTVAANRGRDTNGRSRIYEHATGVMQ